MRSLLALLLCIVMVVGMVPTSVFAAEAAVDTDYVFVATDRHTDSGTSNLGTMIDYMEAVIGDNKLEYLGLGGDMVGSGSTHPEYDSSTVLGEVTDVTDSITAENMDIVAGIHDMNVNDDAEIVLPYQGGGAPLYEGDKYYVYGVEEYCISMDSNEDFWKAQAQAFVDWANGEDIDESKAIIVVSHYPLHKRRNDNYGASYWVDALNSVAATDGQIQRDVMFFWGHNHTGETSDDTDVYHVEPGSSFTAQGTTESESVSYDNIYFTYANAGYLNKGNKEATLIAITDEDITFTKFTSGGSSYSQTGYVERVEVAAPTLESIAITGEISYAIGDELDVTVTAAYSNDTTADVTTAAELSGYNMAVGGYYTVVATYEGLTAELAIKVNPMTVTFEDTNANIITATGTDLTGITAQWNDMDLSAIYGNEEPVVYDITLEGYTEGQSVDICLDICDLPTEGLELYYIDAEGNATQITVFTVAATEVGAAVTFTTDKVGTFAVGVPEIVVSDDAYLTGLTITPPVKTKYFVEDANADGILPLDITGLVVKATYSDGTVKNIPWESFGEVEDGYYLSFDMTDTGYQDVVITYTYGDVTLEGSYKIWIGEKAFENSGVTVAVENPGTVTVTVSNEITEEAASAAAEVAENYEVYNITLEYIDENGLNGTADVTLPIPEGVTDPAVFYISDDGQTVTNMDATDNGDGTVTFTTDHFSAYIVGDSTEIEVDDPVSVEGTGTITTTTEKVIYQLVSSLTAGEEYLIVNSDSAGSDKYGLAGDTTGVSVTVKAADDVSDVVYIEDKGSALEWTAASGWKFSSGDYDLGVSDRSLSFSTSTSWTYSSSNDYLYYRSGSGGGSRSYYLRCSSGTWSVSTSTSNVYFYQKTTVSVESETTANGVFSIEGNPDAITKVVEEGTTATLDSTLTFKPESGSSTTSNNPTGVTYTVVTGGDPNGIIDTIDGSTVTFTGETGTALVKISYEVAGGTVTNYIEVTALAPYYTVDITDGTKPVYEKASITAFEDGVTYYTKDSDGNYTVVTGDYDSDTTYYTLSYYESAYNTIPLKAVTVGDTYDLNNQVVYHTASGDQVLADATVTWTSSNTAVATVSDTGLVTLTGTGVTNITAIYTLEDGTTITDTVRVTAATSEWYTDADGEENIPGYPLPGSVGFDKTATAVGSFNETGIAQVELSMTGVPYGTKVATDVVVMVDMTSSMDSDTDVVAAQLAVQELIEALVYDSKTDTYDENIHLFVSSFSSGTSTDNINVKDQLYDVTIGSDEELEDAKYEIDEGDNKFTSTDYSTSGTHYGIALADVYATLNREGHATNQYVIFVTDGVPTRYYYLDADSDTGYTQVTGSNSVTGSLAAGWFNDDGSVTDEFLTEYYTYLIKSAGISVYTVGCNLSTEEDEDDPVDLINHMSSNYSADGKTSTDQTKYSFTCTTSGGITDEILAIFKGIAESIKEAATDVTVVDKIADEYTMIFDIPTGSQTIEGLDDQEFYIEVLEYTLDSNHERTTSTSKIKLYLGVEDGQYYAASDNEGTAFADPTFSQTAIGTMFYWTTDSEYTGATDSGVSITVSDTTYYFVAAGKSNTASDWDDVSSSWYNMDQGTAYASGTIDATTNVSTDLIIATHYFVYNASTRMLAWTADKLSDSELALSYFLYLDRSATEVGTTDEIDADTYPTNDYAYLTYTNHLNHKVYREFPEPRLTWNGAQVTYLFYLVNADGEPVNQYGQVVDFANAVFVTAPVTESVVWNKETSEGTASLDINWAAENVLPDGYTLFDTGANYELHVYEDETGADLGSNYFIINGDEADGATDSTTKVYNTKAGVKYSAYGTYSSSTMTDSEGNTVSSTVIDDIDFASTTVAFAVLWETKLVEDVVVVDFGLPVSIEVLKNDIVSATVNSVSEEPYDSEYAMNTGIASTGFAAVSTLTLENNDTVTPVGDAIYYVQKDMQFNEPSEFYYDAQVTYYKNSYEQTGYIYSKVTVIPATTVYFEDSFVTLKTYTKDDAGEYIEETGWTTDGTEAVNIVQGTDRPGVGNYNDANNLYGYDPVYNEYSQYSLGTAAMVNVYSGKYATAEFEFYGTGFDVISMTDYTTGTIFVDVYDANGDKEVSESVDTYYGYARSYWKVTYQYQDGEWTATEEETVTALGTSETRPEAPAEGDSYVAYETRWTPVTTNDPNALYQVPVIKIGDGCTTDELTYGYHKVVITASYMSFLDDYKGDTGYNFYLDAIRIYNPTGNLNDTANEAYKADGEGWPVYAELRDWLIDAATFDSIDSDSVSGLVFIDGATDTGAGNTAVVADYTSYGPNNELYLAPGQAVAFDLEAVGSVAKIHMALKTVGGTGYVKAYGIKSSGGVAITVTPIDMTVTTATDLYYDITSLNNMSVIIVNTGDSDDAIVSITNIKTTYTEAPDNGQSMAIFSVNRSSVATSLMLLSTTEENVEMDLVETEDTEIEDTEIEDTETEDTEIEDTETEDTETEDTETEDTETEDTETEDTETEDTETEDTETKDNVIDDSVIEGTESEEENETIVDTIVKIIDKIANALSTLLSRWFS